MNALEIERATIAIWPAAETELYDGWSFLAGSGVTGRVNAVWPLQWMGADVEAAIDGAERWYAARNMPPRFKLTDRAFAPPDLPARLERRGYAPTQPTLVMTRPLTSASAEFSDVELFSDMPPAFDAALVSSTPDPQELEERRAIALRAPRPRAFATRLNASVGMSAVSGRLAGVFLMRTVPQARRQGHARHILRALLSWARAQGATEAFLQVDGDNAPAIALYEQEGFVALTAYRFWRKSRST